MALGLSAGGVGNNVSSSNSELLRFTLCVALKEQPCCYYVLKIEQDNYKISLMERATQCFTSLILTLKASTYYEYLVLPVLAWVITTFCSSLTTSKL